MASGPDELSCVWKIYSSIFIDKFENQIRQYKTEGKKHEWKWKEPEDVRTVKLQKQNKTKLRNRKEETCIYMLPI